VLAIDWRFVAILTAELLVTGLAIYGLNRARKIRFLFARICAILPCTLIALLGSFASLVVLASLGCQNHSALIYSPSGKIAARISDFDAGATGGDTTVTLHWAGGFRSQTVYWGGWKSVGSSDIRWKSDSELTINYDSDYGALERPCSSTPQVTVSCVPR
jgi:hypothetical protein